MSDVAGVKHRVLGALKHVGSAVKHAVRPPLPEWVKEAWLKLTPHEAFTVDTFVECFPNPRIVVRPYPEALSEACAEVLAHRGAGVPASAEERFNALNPQEQRTVAFLRERGRTGSTATHETYGHFYQEIARMRPPAEPSSFEPDELTAGEKELYAHGGATSVAWARGMAEVVAKNLAQAKDKD